MKLRRVFADKAWIAMSVLAVGVAVVPLFSIIFEVAARGISAVNFGFFTQLPPLANTPGGGLGNAVQGTFILIVLASAIGFPIGLFSGVYVSEYGANKYATSIRFLGDVLAGVPSIVTGILAYGLIVLTFGSFSVAAGAIALGMIMIPIVSNTTSAALKSVPNSVREASMALGVRKWRTALLVVSAARKSVATAALLSVARITGETAPLILTAGISSLWFSGVNQPVASLTYYIYYYATSPFQNWVNLAWGAAFILMSIVIGINAAVRIITRERLRNVG